MKRSTFICILILALSTALAFLPFFKGIQLMTTEPVDRKCNCFRCRYSMPTDGPVSSLWERGEFVTLRKAYPHGRCGGQMVFNGKATPAPYSEKEYFYTHVCNKCSETNQILNATWPQYKQEWRSL